MKTFKILIYGVISCCAFLTLLLSDENRVHKQLPKCSLNQSMRDFVSVEGTRILHIDDRVVGTNLYHLVYCKTPFSLLAVKSGPPLYVFDEQGQFVGWVPDSGEGVILSEIIHNTPNASGADSSD